MTKVRFRDLTEDQKKLICNGCGPKGGYFKPPNFIFKDSCNHHDFNYWLGYTEKDRKKADLQFYQAMKRAIKLQPWYKRFYYYIVAYIYYRSVRYFGKSAFNYSDREKTLEDLLKEIDNITT